MKSHRLLFLLGALLLTPGCGGSLFERPMSQKLGWKPADFFTDPQVIALCHVIEANDLDRMRRLIDAGVDINTRGKGNNTPLLWAYFDNQPERFRLLLEHGADPNVVISENLDRRGIIPEGTSVTHIAAHSWFPRHFELVMQFGGDPHLLDQRRNTPLYSVITGTATDKIERIQLLIDAGADLNYRSEDSHATAVSKAVSWFGQYELALFLLKSGADPDVYDYNSNSKLVHTVLKERDKLRYDGPEQQAAYDRLVDWLKQNGADFEAAQADLDLWKAWSDLPPQETIRLHKQAIAARIAQEQAENNNPAPKPPQ